MFMRSISATFLLLVCFRLSLTLPIPKDEQPTSRYDLFRVWKSIPEFFYVKQSKDSSADGQQMWQTNRFQHEQTPEVLDGSLETDVHLLASKETEETPEILDGNLETDVHLLASKEKEATPEILDGSLETDVHLLANKDGDENTANDFLVKKLPVDTWNNFSPSWSNNNEVLSNEAIAHEYLSKYGYFEDSEDFAKSGEITDKVILEAVTKFQKMAQLNETGVIDEHVISAMSLKRCGMKDFLNKEEKKEQRLFERRLRRKKRSPMMAPDGGPINRWWHKCDLTWALVNGTNKVNNYYVRDVLGNAINKWMRAVNQGRSQPVLIIKEGGDGSPFNSPDIQFGFNYGDHGDVLPFDGPGPSVAHSFFPYVSGIFNGHVHFDEYEDWSKRSNVGKLFPLIALHELGHALGLPHNQDPQAVMYPVLDRRSTNSQDLQPQDVAMIKKLYPNKACGPTFRQAGFDSGFGAGFGMDFGNGFGGAFGRGYGGMPQLPSGLGLPKFGPNFDDPFGFFKI